MGSSAALNRVPVLYLDAMSGQVKETRYFDASNSPIPVSTPWGRADSIMLYADGVGFTTTPSHGGFYVSPEAAATMPAYLRETSNWYEEDCSWSKVAVAFREHFPKKEYDEAVRILKNWYPDAYEQHFDCILAPGESSKKDEKTFLDAHKSDWIVISARGTPIGTVWTAATRGGVRGQAVEHRYFIVPQDEYNNRSGQYFVIDEARHERTYSHI